MAGMPTDRSSKVRWLFGCRWPLEVRKEKRAWERVGLRVREICQGCTYRLDPRQEHYPLE